MNLASGDLSGQLISALQHPSPEVRAGAAIALGRLGHSEAVEALIETLADPSRLVHRGAARGLALLGTPAAGALLALIQDPPFEKAAERAAGALGQIRDPAAAGILTAALQYPEPLAREAAISALGEIRHPAALPALAELALESESDLRHKAAAAVLAFDDPAFLHVPIALLNDPDPRLRQMAVAGLGEFGGEGALLPLLTMLSDPDEQVRWAAAAALHRLDEISDAEILLTALNTDSPWVQQAIMQALVRLSQPEVAEALHRVATEEGDLGSRLTAAQCLAILGDSRGIGMIRRTFNAPNVETRRLAAIALCKTGDPQPVEFLLSSISTSRVDLTTPRGRALRERALEALQSVGSPAVSQLILALGDSDTLRRQIAREALLRIGPEAVVELAETVLVYPDVGVRVRAAALLARIGDRRGLEALVTVLRTALLGPFPIVFFTRLFWDRSAPVRRAAAQALGQMGHQDGAAVLLTAARYDPDAAVRTDAGRALARIGAPMVVARFAAPDVYVWVNRGLAASTALLLVGFLAAGVVIIFEASNLGLLAGLVTGAALGLSDAFTAGRRPFRLAFLGNAAAWLLAWAALYFRLPAWIFPVIAIGFPALGGLLGWTRTSLSRRMAGLFAGAVLGLVAGLLALLFFSPAA